MTLRTKGQVADALGVTALTNLPREKLLELASLLPHVDSALAEQLVEQVPGLRAVTVDAVDAVTEVLQAVNRSNDQSQAKVLESLAEVRRIVEGELSRPNISEARAEQLLKMLTETVGRGIAKDSENKEFLKNQARATRFSLAGQSILPIVKVVVVVGAQLLIDRGAPRPR